MAKRSDPNVCPVCGGPKNQNFPTCRKCVGKKPAGEKKDDKPKNPCPACGTERPVGAKICGHCGAGKISYRLVAIPNEGPDGWQINITIYREEQPKPRFGVKAKIDILDEGQVVSDQDIPTTGANIKLPYSRKSRIVRFSIKEIFERGVYKNPDVNSDPLLLPGKRYDDLIRKPDSDRGQGFLHNWLKGWAAAKPPKS